MFNKLSIVLFGLICSASAYAQDYGLTLGVHNTTANVDTSSAAFSGASGSAASRLGFDVGVTASFELLPSFRFRSGLLFDQRQFDYNFDGGGKYSFNFQYLDVPVNVQYNFTEMFGIYGGLVVGIATGNNVSQPANTASFSVNQKSLYPLANVGANFMFNDMIGIDLYYEAGLGSASDVTKNYSTYGLHFIYWL